MKPASEPTTTNSKPASKSQNGLKIRTTVKAGDGPSDPGLRLNHGVKVTTY